MQKEDPGILVVRLFEIEVRFLKNRKFFPKSEGAWIENQTWYLEKSTGEVSPPGKSDSF